MFPGKTVEARKISQRDFANDLGARCHAEQKAAMKAFKGDTTKVNIKITDAKEAIVLCYQGNHTLCKTKSSVCRGTLKSTWITRSAYLPADFTISPNATDLTLLKQNIDLRLGQQVWRKIKYCQNTNKVEGVNRGITSTNPKNLTCSRNYEGRVHAAIHSVNDGWEESIYASCAEARAAPTSGSRVVRQLLSHQKSNQKRKLYKRSSAAIAGRYHKRRTLYSLHRWKRSTKGPTYRSGMMMPKVKRDHTYSKI